TGAAPHVGAALPCEEDVDTDAVELTGLPGNPNASCQFPISAHAYERFCVLRDERGRDEMLDEILFTFWGQAEWIQYAPREVLMPVGSSILFVLKELNASVWEEYRQATLAWAQDGDWGAIADYVDVIEKMEKSNDEDRQIFAMISK